MGGIIKRRKLAEKSRMSSSCSVDKNTLKFPPHLGQCPWVTQCFQSCFPIKESLPLQPLPIARVFSNAKLLLVCHFPLKFSHSCSSQCAQHTGHAALLKEHISTSPIRITRQGRFHCGFLTSEVSPMSQLPVSFVMSPPQCTFAQGCLLHVRANPLLPCFWFGVQHKA